MEQQWETILNWEDVKKQVTEEILSRGLKDPNIRLRALTKVDAIMHRDYPQYVENPNELIIIGKIKFKEQIAEKKGNKLNQAENSIINTIYDTIDPPLPIAPIQKKYQIHTCPYCYTSLRLTEDLYECDNVVCPQCGNEFRNPKKELDSIKKLTKQSFIMDTTLEGMKLIFWIILTALFLYCLWSCQTQSPQKKASYESIAINETHVEKGKFIGTWSDDFQPQILHRIVMLKNGTYIMQVGEKGSDYWVNECDLKRNESNGRILFFNMTEGYDDYYRLEKNGNLSAWDNLGYIGTYKKYK